jgi:hypothetical protein
LIILITFGEEFVVKEVIKYALKQQRNKQWNPRDVRKEYGFWWQM